MANFAYKARSRGGELVTGTIEAATSDLVANQLLANGYVPVAVNELRQQSERVPLRSMQFGKGARVDLDDLVLFCRQMHTLIKAGVPIIRALRGLADSQKKPAMVKTLGNIVDDLETGRDLSQALANHPKVFPLLFSSMIQVGENTGQLDTAFLQLAGYLGLEKETRARIKAALRYPSFVILAIAVAIAIVSFYVIPAFEKVFRGFGAELPLPTRLLMWLSNFSISYWPHILAASLLAFVGFRHYIRTEKGRWNWDRNKLRFPLVGSIILRATLARFSRAFAMGYGAGVPLVQALGFTAKAVDNCFVGNKIDDIRISIERGETLTRSAAATNLFTPLVLQMLAVGEETGAVDTMMLDVAEFYEREVDYDLKNLTTAIEPVLIIFMGIMVLILALGVFLPMWNLGAIAR